MELKDYKELLDKFATDMEITSELYNPYNYDYNLKFRYSIEDKEVIECGYFELTKNRIYFKTDYMLEMCGPLEKQQILPTGMKYYKIDGQWTVNGYPIRAGLMFNTATQEVINSPAPRVPYTEEEKKLATSTLRKHISRFKKRARPLFRLINGSLTEQDDQRRNRRNWTDNTDLNAHELYEILKQETPTLDNIQRIMKAGNSSYGYTFNKTDFETTVSREISRKRPELRMHALAEANKQYKTYKPEAEIT